MLKRPTALRPPGHPWPPGHSAIPVLALPVALALAGCPGGAPAAKPPASKPPVASQAAGAKVVGTIVAPAGILSNVNGGLVAAGGGNMVAAGAGNLVAAGGGNLIGNDVAGYRLHAVPGSGLARCKVYVCDAAYRPLPGVAPVETDANGRYTLPAVPPGTYILAAATSTADGKPAPLLTIVKVGGAGATADVDLATSFVAVVMTEGRSGGLASVDPTSAGYRRATEATAKNLAASDVPFLADPAAILARMEALAAEVAEVKEGLAAMGREIADLRAQLAELQKRLGASGGGAVPASVTGPFSAPKVASVLAGGDAAGFADGAGAAARFGEPMSPIWLQDGRVLVADPPNHAIRAIAPDGTVATLAGVQPAKAGYLDAPVATGLLNAPLGLAIELGPKKSFFVADSGNHVLRGLDLDAEGGARLVTAAGTGQEGTNDEGDPGPATMRRPSAVAVARDGTVFVTDAAAGSLRYMRAGKLQTAKLAPAPGVAAADIAFVEPVGVAAPNVDRVYVADASAGVVFRLKATAPLAYAVDVLGRFHTPQGLAIAANGALLVVERADGRINVVDPDTGKISHVIGGATDPRGATRIDAPFRAPTGVVAGPGGTLYVTDREGPKVWKLTP